MTPTPGTTRRARRGARGSSSSASSAPPARCWPRSSGAIRRCSSRSRVIDFNPQVFRTLADRGMHVIYGDISNVDTLVHAGVGKAETHHPQRPGLAAEGRQQRKAGPPRPLAQSDRQDRRDRRPAGRRRRSLRGRRRLRHGDPAQRRPRAVHGDRGRRQRACWKTSAPRSTRCSASAAKCCRSNSLQALCSLHDQTAYVLARSQHRTSASVAFKISS